MFRRFFETPQDLCSSFLPWVAFQDLSQGRRKFANFGKKLSVFPPWLRGFTPSFWRPFAPKFLRPNSSIWLLPPQAEKTLKLSEWLFHVFASFTGFVPYLSYLFIICFYMFLVCCLYPFIYFICCYLGVDGLLSRIHPHFLPSSTIQIGSSWCSLSSRRLRSSSWAFNAWKHATGMSRSERNSEQERSMERLGAFRGEFQKCLKIQKPSFWVAKKIWNMMKSWNMKWQELSWWMSLWSL